MDLKENWRAWHSNLRSVVSPCLSVGYACCVREVARCLLVFCLLLVQVSGEGEDVGVDLLVTHGAFLAAHDGRLGGGERWGEGAQERQGLGLGQMVQVIKKARARARLRCFRLRWDEAG